VIPLRLARELTYQLDKAGEHERLARALARVPVFLTLYQGEGVSDVLTLWQQLSVKGHEPEKYYPVSLDTLRKNVSGLLPDALLTMHSFFEPRGSYDLCVELLTELRAWAGQHEHDQRAMGAELGLGKLCWRRGDYGEAMMHYTESLRRAESLGDKRNMGGNLCNIALIEMERGRHPEAMALLERALELLEAIGARGWMSNVIGNMGQVHQFQGRYAEAMACLERHLAITESLADKSGMSSAIASLGILHKDQGRYAEAMACYERVRAMAESLGDKRGMSMIIGNMGEVHLDLGRHDEALRSFRSALEGHRAIGFRLGMTHCFEGIGRTLLELGGVLAEARENAKECVRISEEIGKPDTIFSGCILLARIDAAEGNTALATETLEALLAEATDEEQLADLHYWLWKIGGGDRGPGSVIRGENDAAPGPRSPEPGPRHAEEALRQYEALYSRIPKFEFVKRIAELKGERIPQSADDLSLC
jgi:tetratricopeptide (TPR) repeat protein